MRYCQRCGVPKTLTSEHRWLPNGTLTLSRDATHRMIFIDNTALNYLLLGIASQTGMPLDDMIVEAKRKSSKHFMDAVLSGVKGVVARNIISPRVYEQLGKQLCNLGLGRAEVSSYKKRSYLEGTITEGYSGSGITGDICGAFESVEGLGGRSEFDVDVKDTVTCRIEASDVDRPLSDLSMYIPPPTLPGRNIYELCPVCKAPISIGRQYQFDLDRGVILDRKTGNRVVLMGVMTLTSMFGELARELGDQIPGMIMGIEKDRIRDLITKKGSDRDTSDAGYLRYIKTLELKGMGNGRSVSLDNGTIQARIENPYYEPLVAGFLAGFYEAATGKEASVEWTGGASGYTDVTVSPA